MHYRYEFVNLTRTITEYIGSMVVIFYVKGRGEKNCTRSDSRIGELNNIIFGEIVTSNKNALRKLKN